MLLAFVFTITILGLLVGSFLNVVIYRVPMMLFADWRNECREFIAQEQKEAEASNQDSAFGKSGSDIKAEKEVFNIAVPRSHCPVCKSQVKAWQNIPIVSYILLGGKCASCKTPISLRYPIIELITGLLSAFIAYTFGASYLTGLALLLTWSLICLTMIDVDHQLLPDNITLPLLWLGLIANYFSAFTDLPSALLGAIAGYLILWSIYWAFKLLTGKEGMGFGDFKLLAALGAWMGWQMLPTIIILSSLVGAVVGIAGIAIMGKDKNKPIPFGPYLAAAGWIAFFWGEQINQAYLSFSNIA